MQNMPSIDDWSEHMLWAEENFKRLENGLINNQFEHLDANISAVKGAMEQVQWWIDRQRAKNAK